MMVMLNFVQHVEYATLGVNFIDRRTFIYP